MTFSDLQGVLEGDEIVLRVYDDYNTDYLIQEMVWSWDALGEPSFCLNPDTKDTYLECEVMSIFPNVDWDSNGNYVKQIIVEAGHYGTER